jgi:hypothetical protein
MADQRKHDVPSVTSAWNLSRWRGIFRSATVSAVKDNARRARYRDHRADRTKGIPGKLNKIADCGVTGLTEDPMSEAQRRSRASRSTHSELDRFARAFESEAHLREALVTLLIKMGRQEPRINHGALERGKDILFYADGGLQEKALYACVVKNDRIVGNVTSSSAAKTVLHQAEQAFDELYRNPSNGMPERIRGVYIVSPYECPPSAIHSIESRLARMGSVEFVCGVRLMELFARYWSSFLLFESDVLVSYLSGLRLGINKDSAMIELSLRKAILAELPNTFQHMYVAQRVFQQLGGARIREEIVKPVTFEAQRIRLPDFAELQTRVVTLNALVQYLDEAGLLSEGDNPEPTILADYLDSLSKDVALSRKRTRRRTKRPTLAGTRNSRKPFILSTSPTTIALSAKARDVQLAALRAIDRECQRANQLTLQTGSAPTMLKTDEFRSLSRLIDLEISIPGVVSLGSSAVGARAGAMPDTSTQVTCNDIVGADLPSVIVTGPAGFGKTSLCRWYALQDADGMLKKQTDVLPIYVPLHRFSNTCPDTFNAAFITSPELAELIASNRHAKIRLYLDGLDEVPDAGRRATLIGFVRQLQKATRDVNVVVTSRDHVSGAFLSGMPRVRIHELDLGQQRELLKKWLLTDEAVDGFFTELDKCPSIRTLLGVPLLATISAAVYKKQRSLPANRAALYTLFVELLCGGWDFVKGVHRGSRFGPDDKLLVLTRLAGHNHAAGRRSASVADFESAVSASLPKLSAASKSLLDDMLQDGLLVGSGESIQFSHLSFQEFLAAKHLSDVSGALGRAALKKYFAGDDWWREVLHFYVALSGKPREVERWLVAQGRSFVTSRSQSTRVRACVEDLIGGLLFAFPEYESQKLKLRFRHMRSVLSEKQRLAVSQRMRKYWAERRASKTAPRPSRAGRRKMTPAQKKAVSKLMKKYWAKRREKQRVASN